MAVPARANGTAEDDDHEDNNGLFEEEDNALFEEDGLNADLDSDTPPHLDRSAAALEEELPDADALADMDEEAIENMLFPNGYREEDFPTALARMLKCLAITFKKIMRKQDEIQQGLKRDSELMLANLHERKVDHELMLAKIREIHARLDHQQSHPTGTDVGGSSQDM